MLRRGCQLVLRSLASPSPRYGFPGCYNLIKKRDTHNFFLTGGGTRHGIWDWELSPADYARQKRGMSFDNGVGTGNNGGPSKSASGLNYTINGPRNSGKLPSKRERRKTVRLKRKRRYTRFNSPETRRKRYDPMFTRQRRWKRNQLEIFQSRSSGLKRIKDGTKRTWSHPFDRLFGIRRRSPAKEEKRRKLRYFKLWGSSSDAALQFGIKAGWMLRHGAKNEGVPIRPDGYVRVHDMLRHKSFRDHYDFDSIVEFALDDAPGRFQVTVEPEFCNGVGNPVTWIRAREGHSLPGVDFAARRIFSADKVKNAVYDADAEEWEVIRLNGIPQEDGGVVYLSQTAIVEGDVFAGYPGDSRSFVYIYVDVDKALRHGIKFFISRMGKIVTNDLVEGVIPPLMFKKIIRVDLDNEILVH